MSANAEMVAAWDGPEGDHWADNAERYEATSEALPAGTARRPGSRRGQHGRSTSGAARAC